MARTIGKVKVKRLKKIATCILDQWVEEYKIRPMSEVREIIESHVPEEWYDTWESAWAEIERIIHDEITDYQYKK